MVEQSSSIGIRIKQIRKQKGMTQYQAAEAAGIDPKSLSRIESAVFNPALDTLQNLANAFGIEIQEFFLNNTDWITLQKGYLLDTIAKASDEDVLRIAESVKKLSAKTNKKQIRGDD